MGDRSDPRDVDRGWAWMVILGSFTTQFLVGLMNYSAGVVHVALLEEFKGGVAATSLIGALFTSLVCLVGPFVSLLINRTSCRVGVMAGGVLVTLGYTASFFVYNLDYLLVTYGVMAGTGLSLCVVSTIVVVSYSFNKYRGVAVGVNIAGGGMGMLVSGPLTQALLDRYGVHGTFLMLGGLSFHLVMCGALLRPSSVEISQKVNKPHDSKKSCINVSVLTVFTDVTFVCFLASSLLWNFSYSMLLIHLPNFAHVCGADHSQSALLLTVIGFGSTFNRILTGMTQGPGGIDPLLIYMGFLGISGVLTLTFPLYSSQYSGQLLFSLLFGIYSGALIALVNPLSVELVGLQQLSSAVGILYLASGVGYIIGPPVAGAIVDSGGTYEEGFILSGLFFVLSSLISLFSATCRKSSNELNDGVDTVKRLAETRFLSGSSLIGASLSFILQEGKTSQKLSTQAGSRDEDTWTQAAPLADKPMRSSADDVRSSNNSLRNGYLLIQSDSADVKPLEITVTELD